MSVVFTYPIPSSSYKHYLLGSLVSGRPVTIMAWAKTEDYEDGNERGIVEVGRDDPLYALRLSRYTGLLYCYDHMGNAKALNSSPDAWLDEQWNHVCVTSSDNSNRSIWLNGIQYTSSDSSGTGTESMTRIVVGMSLFNVSSPCSFDGKIAHVAIWDIVLDDADIQALAAKSVKPEDVEPDHQIGYWKLIKDTTAWVGDDLTEEGYTDYISYDAGDDPLLEWSAAFYCLSQFAGDLDCITLAPAWRRWTWPIAETLSWNTDILQSHDRTEQRIARRRKVPSQSYRTKILLRGDAEASSMEAVLHRWFKRPWPCPIWPEASQLAAALPAASGSVPVDTQYASYRAGGLAVLWNETSPEILQVQSVAADSVTLKAATSRPWPAGSWIMPLRRARVLSAGQQERVPGGSLVELQLEVVDTAFVPGYTADLTCDGMIVLTDPSLWPGGAGSMRYDPDVAVLDSGAGPFEVVSNSDYNAISQNHGWSASTPAAVWQLRQFLHAIAGSQKVFLVPTFRRDLTLTRPAGVADTSLYVAAGQFASNLSGNTMRTYVAFRNGASLIVRKVSSITAVSAAEECVVIGAAAGIAFAVGSSLCWVDRCRLAQDAVTFDWRSRRGATCNVTLTRVF